MKRLLIDTITKHFLETPKSIQNLQKSTHSGMIQSNYYGSRYE